MLRDPEKRCLPFGVKARAVTASLSCCQQKRSCDCRHTLWYQSRLLQTGLYSYKKQDLSEMRINLTILYAATQNAVEPECSQSTCLQLTPDRVLITAPLRVFTIYSKPQTQRQLVLD